MIVNDQINFDILILVSDFDKWQLWPTTMGTSLDIMVKSQYQIWALRTAQMPCHYEQVEGRGACFICESWLKSNL